MHSQTGSKCLTINDRLFCESAKARGFSAKSKSCNTSLKVTPTETYNPHRSFNQGPDTAFKPLSPSNVTGVAQLQLLEPV